MKLGSWEDVINLYTSSNLQFSILKSGHAVTSAFHNFLFRPAHLDKNGDYGSRTTLSRHYKHGRRRDSGQL
jgi:hypothetical protein